MDNILKLILDNPELEFRFSSILGKPLVKIIDGKASGLIREVSFTFTINNTQLNLPEKLILHELKCAIKNLDKS